VRRIAGSWAARDRHGRGRCAGRSRAGRGRVSRRTVVCQVAVGGQQLAVVDDRAGEAVSAEEVSATAVHAVVVSRGLRVQTLQCFRKACVRNLDERLIVVAHQDIGEQLESVFPEREAEPLHEVAAIVVDLRRANHSARVEKRSPRRSGASHRPRSRAASARAGSLRSDPQRLFRCRSRVVEVRRRIESRL
jgi:hypothetical protein